MRYECHITVEPIEAPLLLSMVNDRAHTLGFRLAKLLMQKGQPSNLDTFMTGHSEDYEDMRARMRSLCGELTGLGIEVRRAKIEEILFDTRNGDIV